MLECYSVVMFERDASSRLRQHGLAMLLGTIVLLILGSMLWERQYLGVMKQSSASMYDDRLMPAASLFRLSDRLHTRRLVLEEHLAGYGDLTTAEVHRELGRLDAEISAAIAEIERTYLVDAESELLRALKAHIAHYSELEKELLREAAAGRHVTYGGAIRESFDDLRAELTGLTEIQEKVGRDLNRESFTAAGSATLLTHFQLGAGFILGLIAYALALNLRLGPVVCNADHVSANDRGSQ